ncbi:hypothetical protein ACFXOY_09630 [Streptomyces niveus]|uniref:AraC-like ligand-binding domain-containing protein n=1 Tax=Streptomyces niveus TaxID=193462 RepID=UPI00368F1895
MLKDASEQGAASAGPVVAVDAGSIPAPDRFGWWSDMVGHEVMPVSIHSAHSGRFQGRVKVVDLPYGQVPTFSNSHMTAHRSSLQIRRQDPEEYVLILVRGSSIRLEQARGVVCLGVGDMGLFSTSQTLACEFHDRDQFVRVTLLRLPRAVLPRRGGGGTGCWPSRCRPVPAPRLFSARIWRGCRVPLAPARRRSWPGSTPSSTTVWPTRSCARRRSPNGPGGSSPDAWERYQGRG